MHDTLFSYFNFALPRRFFDHAHLVLLQNNTNYYCMQALLLLLCQAVCLDATKQACCFFFPCGYFDDASRIH